MGCWSRDAGVRVRTPMRRRSPRWASAHTTATADSLLLTIAYGMPIPRSVVPGDTDPPSSRISTTIAADAPLSSRHSCDRG
jgi:hypothetical protein